jgi:hypothetical protein
LVSMSLHSAHPKVRFSKPSLRLSNRIRAIRVEHRAQRGCSMAASFTNEDTTPAYKTVWRELLYLPVAGRCLGWGGDSRNLRSVAAIFCPAADIMSRGRTRSRENLRRNKDSVRN